MRRVFVIALALLASGCLSASVDPAPSPTGSELAEYLVSGGRLPEPRLSRALEAAAAQPLGSERNPVRADSPLGQRAYLSRLRCENGQAPRFRRVGNMGPGPFGSIVDLYIVECPGSAPARTEIYMDMYFRGYVESRPVEGFTLAP